MRASEGHVRVDGAELFCRTIGEGPAIIVIHGGPDFDHTYLLPDMDRLADAYRLIYYDQRGRGRSRGALRLDELGIGTYVDDLDAVRASFGLESVALLGHSWGGIVAMHYALRHARCVSRLVLLNSAPASHADLLLTRAERLRRRAPHHERLDAIVTSAGFASGEPDAVAEFYRIDYASCFRSPELARRLNLAWTREDILRGRAIERRLMQGLIWSDGYTLIPALAQIAAPTLVVHGARDFVPAECSARIAGAIPGASLVVLPDSGHFSYIDAPEALRQALDAFFA